MKTPFELRNAECGMRIFSKPISWRFGRCGVSLAAAGLVLAVVNLSAAEPAPKRPALTTEELTTWLSPYRTEQATLAPDGRHLAYTVHEEEQTLIVIIDVDEPSRKSVVPVGRDMVIRDSQDKERTPMRVPFFRWVGANRLVFAAELPSLEEVDVRRQREPTNVSVIYAVDADGRHLGKLADEDNLTLLTEGGDTLPRQPRVVDLAGDVPDSILVEAVRPTTSGGSDDPSLLGRVATGLYRINVRTGQRQLLHEQDVNGTLLYDRQGQARIQFYQPVDKAERSFLSVPSPGRKASKDLDKLFGDTITPANLLGTRTFPVGGRYTREQRALYEVVLAAQLAAIDEVLPGRPFSAAHEVAVRVIAEGLCALGLLQESADEAVASGSYKRFFPAKTGHWLGLDVHDVGDYRVDGEPRELEPGMVLTVEPGVYIPPSAKGVAAKWRGIGIRIEDDVVVTRGAAEVITSAVPNDPVAIEALMAR